MGREDAQAGWLFTTRPRHSSSAHRKHLKFAQETHCCVDWRCISKSPHVFLPATHTHTYTRSHRACSSPLISDCCVSELGLTQHKRNQQQPPKTQQKSKEQKMAAAMAGGKGRKKVSVHIGRRSFT